MMQLRDTIITVGRRVMPELSDSELVQLMVSKSVHVDAIELLPLKELPVTKAVNIKVDKSDSIIQISPVHPSFIQEGQEYYSQYKESLIHEPTNKNEDMNTLVHNINGWFVVAFLAYYFKACVLPRMVAMFVEVRKVSKGEVV